MCKLKISQLVSCIILISLFYGCNSGKYGDGEYGVGEGVRVDTLNYGLVTYVADSSVLIENMIIKEAYLYSPNEEKLHTGSIVTFNIIGNKISDVSELNLGHDGRYWHFETGAHKKYHVTKLEEKEVESEAGGELFYNGELFLLRNFQAIDTFNFPISSSIFNSWISVKNINNIVRMNNRAYIGFLRTTDSNNYREIEGFRIAVEALLNHPSH